MKKEEKIDARIKKTKAIEAKMHKEKVKETEEKRHEKQVKLQQAERARASEVHELVKAYYKEIKAHQMSKEEKRR